MNNNTLLEATKKFGTPLYVYNSEKIRAQYTRLTKAFKQVKKLQLNYAVKALSNISVLKYINKLGAGIDTVSIQEVLLFPQMKPEKWDSGPDLEAFKNCGIPEEWLEHVYNAGFNSVEDLKEAKKTAIHQKLNGFRKKNKLDIPALQLEDIENWSV